MIKNYRQLFLVSGIIGLAVFLRFWHIESLPQSIDWDVTVTFNSFLYSPGEYFWDRPLAVLLYQGFLLLFGVNRYSVLIPGILLGLFSMIPIYLLAKRLLGQRTALCSLLLVALSSWHIHYCRLGYLEILLAALLSWFLILLFFQGLTIRPNYFIGFGCVLGLALFNFYPSSVPVIIFYVIGCFFFVRRQKFSFKYFMAGIAIALLLYVTGDIIFSLLQGGGWAAAFKGQLGQFLWRSGEETLRKDFSLVWIVGNFKMLIRNLFWRMNSDWLLGIFRIYGRPLLDPITAVFFLAGIIYHLFFCKRKVESRVLIVWLVSVLLAYTVFIKPHPRYILVLLPLPYLLAADMLVKFLDKVFKTRWCYWAVTITIIVAIFAYNYTSYFVVYRSYYSGCLVGDKEASKYIGTNYNPADTIVLSNTARGFRQSLSFYTDHDKWQVEDFTRFRDKNELLEYERLHSDKTIVYRYWYSPWVNPRDLDIFKEAHPLLAPRWMLNPGNRGSENILYEVGKRIYLPIYSDKTHQIPIDKDYIINFLANKNFSKIDLKKGIIWEEKFHNDADLVSGEVVNVQHTAFVNSITGLEAEVEFNGGAREDEYVMFAMPLNLVLPKNVLLMMDYEVEAPFVQTIELVLHIDYNGDKSSDGYFRAITNPEDAGNFVWDLGAYFNRESPPGDSITALNLEIRLHKLWGVDCSNAKAGKYKFEVKRIAIWETEQLEYVFKDWNPVRVFVDRKEINWDRKCLVEGDLIFVSFSGEISPQGNYTSQIKVIADEKERANILWEYLTVWPKDVFFSNPLMESAKR